MRSIRVSSALLFVCASLALVACSGGSGGGTGGGDSGTNTGGGDTGTGGAGGGAGGAGGSDSGSTSTGSDTSSSSTGTGGGGDKHTGIVHGSVDPGYGDTYFTVSFQDVNIANAETPTWDCQAPKAFGPCSIYHCVVGEAPPAKSAGDITVTGGKQPFTITAGKDASYQDNASFAGALWEGGETLTFKAAGAEIPAFEATLVAPPAGEVLLPLRPEFNAALVIDRTADFDVQWDVDGDEKMFVNGGTTTKTDLSYMTCVFDAAAKSGTIPKEALAEIQPGGGGLTFRATRLTVVEAGDWSVTVKADSIAKANDGGTARFAAQYQ